MGERVANRLPALPIARAEGRLFQPRSQKTEKKDKKNKINRKKKSLAILSKMALVLMKSILILLLIPVSILGAELNPKFLKAIHQVETGGRFGAIKGDNGKALGPFQIHKAYFLDAQAFDKSLLVWKYEDVSRYDVAVKVVTAYANKYEPKAVTTKDFETLARLHNGGAGWRGKKNKTNNYWAKVKKAIDN